MDPVLLTPGPLTTTPRTREAMLRDWGSWDSAFNALVASVCRDLRAVIHAGDDLACVPMQGSGTFSVEAAIGSLVPRQARVLVPNNGAYCRRILQICRILGRATVDLPVAEDRPATGALVEAALAADPSITHVAQVYCETGAGILNDLEGIAAACERRGVGLVVDAMSAFGALPIDARHLRFDGLVAASGKCIEGVPGLGFVFARRTALAACAGQSHSLALDLADQLAYLERTGQFRYTPPTHVVAALRAAIDQFHEEGGQPARLQRYTANCATLIAGMAELGLRPYLPAAYQAPIIVTFHAPRDPAYSFSAFYEAVRAQGFILYPGKLTEVETFRVGCIGAIDAEVMRRVCAAVGGVFSRLGIRDRSPAGAGPDQGLSRVAGGGAH